MMDVKLLSGDGKATNQRKSGYRATMLEAFLKPLIERKQAELTFKEKDKDGNEVEVTRRVNVELEVSGDQETSGEVNGYDIFRELAYELAGGSGTVIAKDSFGEVAGARLDRTFVELLEGLKSKDGQKFLGDHQKIISFPTHIERSMEIVTDLFDFVETVEELAELSWQQDRRIQQDAESRGAVVRRISRTAETAVKIYEIYVKKQKALALKALERALVRQGMEDAEVQDRVETLAHLMETLDRNRKSKTQKEAAEKAITDFSSTMIHAQGISREVATALLTAQEEALRVGRIHLLNDQQDEFEREEAKGEAIRPGTLLIADQAVARGIDHQIPEFDRNSFQSFLLSQGVDRAAVDGWMTDLRTIEARFKNHRTLGESKKFKTLGRQAVMH
jgi:hypothetical protein